MTSMVLNGIWDRLVGKCFLASLSISAYGVLVYFSDILYIGLTADFFFISLIVIVNGECHFHIYVTVSYVICRFLLSSF
jgi:hypothetical protein